MIKCGSFTTLTTTGQQVVSTPGLDPVSVLVFVTPTNGSSSQSGMMIGFARKAGSGVEHLHLYHLNYNNSGNMGSRVQHRTDALLRVPSSTSSSGRLIAEVLAFSSESFTIDITTNADSEALRVDWIAFGADVLTTVGAVECPTSPGVVSIDAGFTPKLCLTLPALASVTFPYTSTTQANTRFSIGLSDGQRQAVAGIGVTNGASTAAADGYFSTAHGAAFPADGGPIATASVTFDGTAVDFTFDLALAIAGKLPYIVLGGDDLAAYVGSGQQPTSTGTQSLPATGVDPLAALLISHGHADAGSQPHALLHVGATDGGTFQVSRFSGVEDDASSATAIRNRTQTIDKALDFRALNGSGSTRVACATAALSEDTLDLAWDTVDSTARRFGYVALGSPSGAPSGGGEDPPPPPAIGVAYLGGMF